MLIPQRVSLLLAAILLASSVALVVIAYSEGETSASTQPRFSGLLRRHDRQKAKLTNAETNMLRRGQEKAEERVLEDRTPKNVPIKVKIREEVLKKFKDVKNDRWHRDLEIDVKNTGNKPIYFMYFTVVLDDVTKNGYPLGFPLRYGRRELIDTSIKADVDDVPLKPGETYVFKISEKDAVAWEHARDGDNLPSPRSLHLNFLVLSFGDGTGYLFGEYVPHPKTQSANPRWRRRASVGGLS
jgi:hypothetical protein